MPQVTHEQAYSRKSSLKYTQSYTNLKLLNKRKSTQQLQGLDSPLKSQRLTGQLLADKVIPWRLKLQELFFFFLKEVVPVSPENWGGREDFSTRIHGASASANKVFPEEGGSGRRLRARTTTSPTSTQKPTHIFIPRLRLLMKVLRPALDKRSFSSSARSVNNVTIKSLGR